MAKKIEVAPAGVGRLALTESELAADLALSLSWLRKDRQTKRRLPYFKIGGAVRYNRDRVLQALTRMEEGGVTA